MTAIRYPIYSRDWHGISLVDVARECGMAETEVANHHLYAALYKRWSAIDFVPEPGWLAAKAKMADVLRASVARLNPNPIHAVSLGAGLGVVEAHLHDAGWRIELQECQAESLAYATRRFTPERVWTCDFDGIPSAAYDVVLALSIVYVFDDAQYRAFAAQCRRMLRPGGLLVIWDHDPKVPLALVKRYVNRYMLRRHDLRWGWLRSADLHEALVQSQGFERLVRQFFDLAIDPVPDPPRLLGMQWPLGRSVAQNMIFRATP